jgi:hypothetical protein
LGIALLTSIRATAVSFCQRILNFPSLPIRNCPLSTLL